MKEHEKLEIIQFEGKHLIITIENNFIIAKKIIEHICRSKSECADFKFMNFFEGFLNKDLNINE